MYRSEMKLQRNLSLMRTKIWGTPKIFYYKMIYILFVVIVEISFSWLQGLDQLNQTKGMTQLGFTTSL